MHTPEFFIDLFEAIPPERWSTLRDGGEGRTDVAGHLGAQKFQHHGAVPLAAELMELLKPMGHLLDINDFHYHLGDDPRERILVALENILGSMD
jgi:hypothetical protein